MPAHIFGYTILNDVSARDARMIDSDGPIEKLRELVEAEKKGMFYRTKSRAEKHGKSPN